MIAKKMKKYVEGSSVIRAMFEEGAKMAKVYGKENVFDFSLGNPSVAPPSAVKDAMIDILNEGEPSAVHGYMANAGHASVREAVAGSLNGRHGTAFGGEDVVMTVGAAGGLNVILKTLVDPGDEVVVLAPFFGEYANYIANVDGVVMVVPPNTETFQPNLAELERVVTPRTKAVITNSPNNPTGVVYSEATIREMAAILSKRQEEYGTSIYLISDEPYRELAYDGVEVPYLTKYYRNTIVGYSYSKSLSLPGERIGYLVIPKEVDDYGDVVGAAHIANRILGFVNAPSLLQLTVEKCIDTAVDVSPYDKNRKALYEALVEYGYECVKPQGAFYLFVKALGGDDAAFVAKAKQYHLLLVPGSSFGCPGYVRIAYCCDYDKIIRSLPYFKQLAGDYASDSDVCQVVVE